MEDKPDNIAPSGLEAAADALHPMVEEGPASGSGEANVLKNGVLQNAHKRMKCNGIRCSRQTSVSRPSFPQFVVDEAAVENLGVHIPEASETGNLNAMM